MKCNKLIFSTVICVTLFLSSLNTKSIAAGKTAIQEERNAYMKKLSSAMREISRTESTKNMEAPTIVIIEYTKKLKTLWPPKSGGDNTRAKEKIWANINDFNNKMLSMEAAASSLLKSISEADIILARKAFRGVGKTCSSCHKLYRGPKVD
tara:strand:- start:200 stop:652 length:453 start_codon:yes stop_codon:yes gene_type:complete